MAAVKDKVEKLEIGDYVLATKWHDGDPNDHWVIGYFSGYLQKITGCRYMVVDSEGDEFRGNGFRRIKKITPDRARWLIDRSDIIQKSGYSIWYWVRRKMEE